MGQKTHPYAFRIGIVNDWKSRWFSEKDYTKQVNEDYRVREFLISQLIKGAISRIDIESKDFGLRHIDSRPSDALAIALRMHAPILVAKEVMNEAIVWENDSLMIEDEIKQSPEIQTLEQQLQKAIDKEEYEIAARIRDKIKDIDN